VRFRLTVAYLGAPFVGWQRQPNGPSVQEALEEALAGLARAPVGTVAAGRTDAGVHARGQVVHVDLERPLPARALVHGVNPRLPPGVRVLAAAPAADGFHARRSVAAREYRYRILRAEVADPFAAPFAWHLDGPLDLAAICAATAALPGRHDFAAFTLAGGSHRTSVRTLFAAAWREEGEELSLRVVGDAFLRGMVRGLVGTLVEVGRGRRSPEGFARLLAGAPRSAAGPTAPPQGLCLERVYYPETAGGPAWEPAREGDPAPSALC
jgi:tRNA pseudouridine38-40 synthase